MLRIRISNMSCGGCAKGAAATLREVDPTVQAAFDLETRQVSVEGTPGNPERLIRALVDSGWKAERLPA